MEMTRCGVENVREVIGINGGGSDVTWLGCALKSYIGRSGWFMHAVKYAIDKLILSVA
jgi:hypothetical protein